MTQNVPVVNPGMFYVNGLQVSRNATTPTTKLDVQAGAARDSNNVICIQLRDAVTIDAGSVGANGLDTGSLANNTWYYVFVIMSSANQAPVAALLSTSRTAPVLPWNYDSFRMIGVWKTDGSAQFLKATVVGNGSTRKTFWDAAISATVGGSGSATSLTAIDLSAGVPPIEDMIVSMQVGFTPAASGNTVGFTPYGSSATAITKVTGFEASVANSQQVQVLAKLASGIPTVLYINSAASCATVAAVSSFELYI